MANHGSALVEKRLKTGLADLLTIDFNFKDPNDIRGLYEANKVVWKATTKELENWRIVVVELLEEQAEKQNHTMIVQLFSPLLALIAVAFSLLGASAGVLIIAIFVAIGFASFTCIVCINNLRARESIKSLVFY